MDSLFTGFVLWICCIAGIFYLMHEILLQFSLIVQLSFLWSSASCLFFVFIYLSRVERPTVYTQIDAYPHKFIAPFLTTAYRFHPTPWLFNRYLETYLPDFIKGVGVPFVTTTEIISVKSMDTDLYLDGQCSITSTPVLPFHSQHPQLSPILIIVPGLTGDVNSKYCRRMMVATVQNGWQAIIFNPRGRGGVKFQSAQAYSVGYTEDLRQCIQYIHDKYPHRTLFACGYSLGANYLAKYMGEEGVNSLLSSAVCCSAPTDPIVCNAALKKQPVMDRALTWILKKVMLNKDVMQMFKTRGNINVLKASSCSRLRQFDHYVIAPQFGFRSCTEYYRKSGAGPLLMDIAKPTLFLYAQNDITVPIDVFCPEDYDGNSNLMAVVTRYGGHSMSWLQGVWRLKSWQTQITIQYLNAVFLLTSRNKYEQTVAWAAGVDV